MRPGKRLKPGTGAVVDFADADGNVALSAEIVDWARPAHDEDPHDGAQRGERVARLTTQLPSLDEALHAVGHTPLPPTSRVTPATKNCIKRYIPAAKARRRHPRPAYTSRPSSSTV